MPPPIVSLVRASRIAPARLPHMSSRLQRISPSRPVFRKTLPGHTMLRPYSEGACSSVDPPEHLSEGERKVFDMIKQELEPTELEVQDISGGCGSMYALHITSSHFTGLSVIKQHRLVNKVLGDEIKKWHGIQLRTQVP